MSTAADPPPQPPLPPAPDVTAAEQAARNAHARPLTAAEQQRLAAEASRDEDA
jgi:hypothetical protein